MHGWLKDYSSFCFWSFFGNITSIIQLSFYNIKKIREKFLFFELTYTMQHKILLT